MPKDPVAEWRQFDMHARLAEEELRSAWLAYLDRKGPRPTREMTDEVNRRRAIAHQLLLRAIDERERS